MKIVITGTSTGIGKAIAEKFLNEKHTVIGIDILQSTINHSSYTHYECDITKELPEIDNVNVLINNAGVQTMSFEDINVNLIGAMKVTEKYAFQSAIKAVVNIASTSGSTGAEFPEYAASKGGLIAYTKNIAMRLAAYKATANSISPGGVITDLNKHILEDKALYKAVLDETLLNKWASVEEIAEWTYFVAVINKSMTGMDLIIDNGEKAKFNFIW